METGSQSPRHREVRAFGIEAFTLGTLHKTNNTVLYLLKEIVSHGTPKKTSFISAADQVEV